MAQYRKLALSGMIRRQYPRSSAPDTERPGLANEPTERASIHPDSRRT